MLPRRQLCRLYLVRPHENRRARAVAVRLGPVSCCCSSEWLEPPPASAGSPQQWKEIPATAFFEVPASRLAAAEAWLSDTAALLQEPNGIAYFGRPDFKCTESTRPYLVRALYTNGGTGRFSLHWAGSALVVSHESLGRSSRPFRSALVACSLCNPQPSLVRFRVRYEA